MNCITLSPARSGEGRLEVTRRHAGDRGLVLQSQPRGDVRHDRPTRRTPPAAPPKSLGGRRFLLHPDLRMWGNTQCTTRCVVVAQPHPRPRVGCFVGARRANRGGAQWGPHVHGLEHLPTSGPPRGPRRPRAEAAPGGGGPGALAGLGRGGFLTALWAGQGAPPTTRVCGPAWTLRPGSGQPRPRPDRTTDPHCRNTGQGLRGAFSPQCRLRGPGLLHHVGGWA